MPVYSAILASNEEGVEDGMVRTFEADNDQVALDVAYDILDYEFHFNEYTYVFGLWRYADHLMNNGKKVYCFTDGWLENTD